MPTTYYCTSTDLGLVRNVNEQTALEDDNGDGTADTGMQEGAMARASFDLYGILKGRCSALVIPTSYVAGTYRGLELQAAALALAYLGERQAGAVVARDHPAIVWATRISLGISDLA